MTANKIAKEVATTDEYKLSDHSKFICSDLISRLIGQ